MPDRDIESATVSPNPDRLNTWKEIAAYLDKGVRTVERWERELGLPVHRVTGRRGETVYASKTEIERWLGAGRARGSRVEEEAAASGSLSEPGDAERGNDSGTGARTPTDSILATFDPEKAGGAGGGSAGAARWRPRRQVLLVAAALVLVVAAALLLPALFRSSHQPADAAASAPAEPNSWAVVDGALLVFDARGTLIGTRRFSGPLAGDTYARTVDSVNRAGNSATAELDGDGRKALVFVSLPPSVDDRALWVFDRFEGGRLHERFAYRRQTGEVRTADGSLYTPPFVPSQFLATPDRLVGDLPSPCSIWLISQHNLRFPSIVQRIDPSQQQPRVLSEYWSAGHVESLADGMLGDRHVLMVGSTNNEHASAALAVLDYENPSGTAPATAAEFLMTNGPTGRPLAYMLFPRTHVADDLANTLPTVREVRVESEHFTVTVRQGGMSREGHTSSVDVYYTFDESYRLKQVLASQAYVAVHNMLAREGVVNHEYSEAADKADFYPVRIWDESQSKFVVLSSGPR